MSSERVNKMLVIALAVLIACTVATTVYHIVTGH